MNRILLHLIQGLDSEERQEVERRYQAMVAEMAFLQENKPQQLIAAGRKGWSQAKLEVVFCLNSFYQRILAPLVASAADPHVVGTDIPIKFGTAMRFDAGRVGRMLEMESRFMELCVTADVEPFMLEAQRAGDLIWRLGIGTDHETEAR